mgnify:CR=1 FL=1
MKRRVERVAGGGEAEHLGDVRQVDEVLGLDERDVVHQLGDGAAVAGALDDEVGDDGDRFGMVELDAALEPAPRHHCRHGNQKLVLFAGRQIHASTLMIST